MVMDKQTIILEIKNHIADRGGSYSEWYVGIATDPETRLFNDHNVNRDTDKWIYKKADSEQMARDVEVYFLNQLKTDGGTGGGNIPNFVYAYRKSNHTEP